MTTLVALLRGINVAGHKPVRMETLRSAFAKAGYRNVRTYVQSGNVVFDAPRAPTSAAIQTFLKKTLSLNVAVVLRTPKELARIVRANPYDEDPGRLYVTFLSESPPPTNLEKLRASAGKANFIGRDARFISTVRMATGAAS